MNILLCSLSPIYRRKEGGGCRPACPGELGCFHLKQGNAQESSRRAQILKISICTLHFTKYTPFAFFADSFPITLRNFTDYMRDHGSIGHFLGNDFFCVGNLALSVLGLFLFYFCLVWGEQVTDAQNFGWQSKGEDHFRSWFPFFSCLVVTILYCSDIVWSKDLSAYFFFFDRGLSSLSFSFFSFSHSLIRNFLSFLFTFHLIGLCEFYYWI